FNYIYLKQCVESSPIVPIQQEWLDHMLMLVPESLKEGKEREKLVQSLINEVSSDFEKSMKRYLVRSVLVKPDINWLEDEGGPLPESPVGLDYSKPWHSNYLQTRNQILANLHIVHPTMKMLLDLGYTTFANTVLLDLTGIRGKGPIDCESLRNDLSIQARKAEEKIMNTWYPKVINLFTKKEALEGIKPEKLDAFYNCVSTLMSNQLIENAKHRKENELIAKREKLILEIEKESRRMEEFAEFAELDRMQQYVTDVRQLQKRIQESEEAVQFINKEEELFKWELTKYPELDKLKVNIEPYQKFFNLVLKWQRTEKRWMDGGFLDLNGEAMETDVEEFSREIFKTLKFFQTKQKKELQEKRKAAKRRSLEEEKLEEEPKENPTITMCTTVMEQIKVFK
ncbi:hypothetical protein Celaphus_00010424, partial [Cervus elaphus hippelaphus]